MEIIKNLNDSEEMIFLQAIDQNYIDKNAKTNEKISPQPLNEDNCLSDIEEYNRNLNFNFIEFSDDSAENSPNSKISSNNENYSNSVFSNYSTDAENNINTLPTLNTENNCNSKYAYFINGSIINKNNVSVSNCNKNISHNANEDKNQLFFSSNEKNDKIKISNNFSFEEKNFSVKSVNLTNANNSKISFAENYSLEEYNKTISNLVKRKNSIDVREEINFETDCNKEHKNKGDSFKNLFLKKDFSEISFLKKEICIQKEKLKQDINQKIISHMKYLGYINFYNKNIAAGSNLINTTNNNTEKKLSVINDNQYDIDINNFDINNQKRKVSLKLDGPIFISSCLTANKINTYKIEEKSDKNINKVSTLISKIENKINLTSTSNNNNINKSSKNSIMNINLNNKSKKEPFKGNSDENHSNIALNNFSIVTKKANKKKK